MRFSFSCALGMTSGACSTMTDEVSSPYHWMTEPAARRTAYLRFRMISSVRLSSDISGTARRSIRNLKLPTCEGP